MYILKVYSRHYTLRENTNVKKHLFVLNKWHKNVLFFPARALTHHCFNFVLGAAAQDWSL